MDDLLAALGVALDGAFGLTRGLRGVRRETFGRFGAFANLANPRVLVLAVGRLRMQFQINGLAASCVLRPAKGPHNVGDLLIVIQKAREAVFHQASTSLPPRLSTSVPSGFHQRSIRGATTHLLLRNSRRRMRTAYFVIGASGFRKPIPDTPATHKPISRLFLPLSCIRCGSRTVPHHPAINRATTG